MIDYGVMVQTVELKIGMADATDDEVSQSMALGLNSILNKVKNAIKNMPEGGEWEIINHQLTRIERHLIVSFLLGRIS
ncbi:MAG TPA: hypothetical protein G4O18_01975 [Dehalococcoidia bacterium]|nr:hypothetical protein [Dehalococcoidia bacterium]